MAQVGDEVWVGARCNIYAYNIDTYFQEGTFKAHDGDVHVIMSTKPTQAWTASDIDIRVWQREVRLIVKRDTRERETRRETELVWLNAQDNSLSHSATLKIHTGKILCLGMADGLVWSGSFDTNIIIWDVETFQPVQELSGGHDDAVKTLTVTSAGAWSGSMDGKLVRWTRS